MRNAKYDRIKKAAAIGTSKSPISAILINHWYEETDIYFGLGMSDSADTHIFSPGT